MVPRSGWRPLSIASAAWLTSAAAVPVMTSGLLSNSCHGLRCGSEAREFGLRHLECVGLRCELAAFARSKDHRTVQPDKSGESGLRAKRAVGPQQTLGS